MSQALLNYDTLDSETKALVDERMKGYKDPKELAVERRALSKP